MLVQCCLLPVRQLPTCRGRVLFGPGPTPVTYAKCEYTRGQNIRLQNNLHLWAALDAAVLWVMKGLWKKAADLANHFHAGEKHVWDVLPYQVHCFWTQR